MKKTNATEVTEFILLVFSIKEELAFFLFFVICIIYLLSCLINFLVIIIIKFAHSLHKPMYFFIGAFSFLEIWYPTATVPMLLSHLLTGRKSISIIGCIVQCYLHFSMGVTEIVLLIIMAYDRYVAICNPLRYTSIMKLKLCAQLTLISWVIGFLVLIIPLIQLINLHFCGSNKIDYYYCEFIPLLRLSCPGAYFTEMPFFVLSCLVTLVSLLLIIISYSCILFTIIRLPTAQGKEKAFSTCTSHLTVICIFYGTLIFLFVKPPGSNSWHYNKMVSLLPSVVTPLLNPIIYTLRNKEIIDTLKKVI